MARKKAKRLRKQHAATFSDWLDMLSPEQLERVRVSANWMKPSFRVTFAASGVEASKHPGSEGIQRETNRG